MTYEQALAYIHGAPRFARKPNLDRIRKLLAEMGHPEKKLKVVHIAGTNGKGSSAAMTESVLRQAGYRTGLFISPYLEDFRERIQIGREMIDKEDLARYTGLVKDAADRVAAAGGPPPKEFEIVFAVAAQYFMDKSCDVAVLEVGLGGRWDATNAIDVPLAAAITSISFDHMEYLGDTLAAIASEKSGIIKPGGQVALGPRFPQQASETILRDCAEKGAVLHQPDMSRLEILREDVIGSRFRYRGAEYEIRLPGRHQIDNALTVLEIMDILRTAGYRISDDDLRQGLVRAFWAGRLEKVRDKPLCFLDGAHNEDAVAALTRTIDTLLPGRRIISVMGMMKNKEYEKCIPMIAKKSAVFIASQPDIAGALPAEEAALTARPYCNAAESEKSVGRAVEKALSLAGPDDALIVCGSLYLIGQARRFLLPG